MAFLTIDDFSTKLIRNRKADPATNPQPVKKGTLIISSDNTAMYQVVQNGHLGGDNFEVQFTAGSNLVIIPNNVLNWSGLKLFSPQFPAGVAITGKTANYREYTIAAAATVTRREFANFCYTRAYKALDFGQYNTRIAVGTNMNLLTNEGQYYMPSTTSNLPESGAGYYVDVLQSGSSVMQIARANTVDLKSFHRRSVDGGITWGAWFEALSSHSFTWVSGTLQNSFTTYNSLPVQFAKQGNLCWLKGQVTPPGTYGDSYTTVTIPTAYRPAETQYNAITAIGTGAGTYPVNRLRISNIGILAIAHNFAVQAWDLTTVYRLT